MTFKIKQPARFMHWDYHTFNGILFGKVGLVWNDRCQTCSSHLQPSCLEGQPQQSSCTKQSSIALSSYYRIASEANGMQEFTGILLLRRRMDFYPVCFFFWVAFRSFFCSLASVRLSIGLTNNDSGYVFVITTICFGTAGSSSSFSYFTVIHHSWDEWAAVGHCSAY